MPERQFPVEAGHVLLFRRAIGDPDAAYDPEALAPPTFVVAGAQFEPTHPLRPAPGEPWFGSGRTPSGTAGSNGGGGGAAASTLHAEQHFTYHRPVRAGDVLTASSRPGGEWTKEGKRGGTLRFTEFVTEYRDAAGELVVTARAVAVTPSQAPVGEA
ncbi:MULTISPECIES: FAS1-like dehydratase domain-containing protein [unclassified Blastococcus]